MAFGTFAADREATPEEDALWGRLFTSLPDTDIAWLPPEERLEVVGTLIDVLLDLLQGLKRVTPDEED